jgi:hypothetical protein
MRYTASQFKNEVDVLEIRLKTIGHLVDCIVIGEATVDQRGRPKDLVFPDHMDRWAPWLEKISYVIIDDMPGGTAHEDDIARERHQRESLIRGMPHLQPEDWVYVSDLDEIPYPEALENAFTQGVPVRFGMDLFVYALNWRWLERGCRIGTLGAVLRGSDILQNGVCWAVLWDSRVVQYPDIAGWHLTYQGGVQAIQAKITGMMDKAADLVMPGVDPEQVVTEEWILESIQTGRDIFGRTYRPTEWVGLDQLPPCVQDDPERYRHMMVPRPANQDEIESVPRCTCGGVFINSELSHFPYCCLAELPDTLVFRADNRARPRAKDV